MDGLGRRVGRDWVIHGSPDPGASCHRAAATAHTQSDAVRCLLVSSLSTSTISILAFHVGKLLGYFPVPHAEHVDPADVSRPAVLIDEAIPPADHTTVPGRE